MRKPMATIRAQSNEGQIAFSLMGGPEPWIGQGDGTEALTMTLNMLFTLRNSSPADGQPGARVANEAAEWLHKTVGLDILGVDIPEGGGKPGTIY